MLRLLVCSSLKCLLWLHVMFFINEKCLVLIDNHFKVSVQNIGTKINVFLEPILINCFVRHCSVLETELTKLWQFYLGNDKRFSWHELINHLILGICHIQQAGLFVCKYLPFTAFRISVSTEGFFSDIKIAYARG